MGRVVYEVVVWAKCEKLNVEEAMNAQKVSRFTALLFL